MNPPASEGSEKNSETRRQTASGRTSTAADPPTVVSGGPPTAPTLRTDSSSKTGSADAREPNLSTDAMPTAGMRIGNYELGPPIGIGGMATVYAAQDMSLERTVALKILPPKSAQDNEVLQRFLLEGKAAARLDHPNIASIYALGHDGSYYYLAFEYVEGRTVRQWIEDQKRIDIDQVLDWSIQTALALAHADRRGVVHRDIKPSNLIVTPAGQVKLVDLGLARRYESQGQVDLTQSGVTLGTFDYISPEQARDPRSVDIRSDLYSLGCTMFHMLTGVPPFPGQNVVQKLLQHQEVAAPDVRSVNSEVPVELAEAVARLMAKAPADRPASAEACVKILQSIRDARLARSATAIPEVQPNSIRGLLAWVVPAVLLTVAITIGSWLSGNSRKDEVVADSSNSNPIPSNRESPEQPAGTQAEPIVPRPLTSEIAQDRELPTIYRVKDGSTLTKVLRECSPGSVILLTEPVRYEIQSNEAELLSRTDLTIRGDTGVRPTIVSAIPEPDEIAAGETVTGLLRFRDSRVTIQNVVFDLGTATGEWVDSGIVAENCDLTLRDVLFLGDPSASSTNGGFIRIVKSENDDDAEWKPSRIENCRFIGNRAAVSGQGPLDISVTDSAMLSSEPIVEVAETDREIPWPCQIRMEHVNYKATAWTSVLELGNSSASVRVRNSVFAPKPGVQMILVSSRRPSRVDWFGRENLYGEISSFMESPRVEEEIVDFDTWSRSTTTVREQSSLATKQFVYGPVESVALALEGRWADAFAMNRGPWTGTPVGVRAWSESGESNAPRLPETELAVNDRNLPDTVKEPNRSPIDGTNGPKSSETAVNRTKPVEDRGIAMVDAPPMPMPMQVDSPSETNRTENADSQQTRLRNPAGAEPTGNAQRREADEVAAKQAEPISPPSSDSVSAVRKSQEKTDRTGTDAAPEGPVAREISTADEFRKALRSSAPSQGASLTLRSGSVIRLDESMTTGEGRLIIAAQPGEPRPRIVFSSRDRAFVENRARWTIEKGATLRLRGIDIEWDANEPAQERLFEVATGTQLVLEECSVTLRSPRSDLNLFATSNAVPDDFAEPSSLRATIRLIDCIVRTAGGVIRSPGEIRCEAEMTGTLVVCGRPLITIDSPSRLQTAQTTRLQLNQSTIVLGSSLATVNLGRALVEQPHLECQVRRSVLAGNLASESPLFEVLGGDPDEEISDCISWEGEEVAYHQWMTYRMDRNNLSGMLARRQNREEWQLTHTQQDNEPIHGEIEFERGNFWTSGRKPWDAKPDEFVIDAESPANGLGARMDRLPRLPSDRIPSPSEFDQDFPEP